MLQKFHFAEACERNVSFVTEVQAKAPKIEVILTPTTSSFYFVPDFVIHRICFLLLFSHIYYTPF